MKIQYIINILNEKNSINSIIIEDKIFIRQIVDFVGKYSKYKDHLPKFIIQKLFDLLKKQECHVKKRYENLGKIYSLSITCYIISSIKKRINLENEDLYKDYSLSINHKSFSSVVFDKYLSLSVNLIAYRGDSRDASIIFQQGFQSLYNPNLPVFSNRIEKFMEDVFISGQASVALSSDFKAAAYFPIKESIFSYIYICKVRKAYNTAAEHYKRFVLKEKNVSNEYLLGVRLNEINTDIVEPLDVYAAFKIERSLIHQFGSIDWYGYQLPLKRSFKIKSIIFNNSSRDSLQNKEFFGIKNYLNSVCVDLIGKEFVFSVDEIVSK